MRVRAASLVEHAQIAALGESSFDPINGQVDRADGQHRSGVLQFNAISPKTAMIALRLVRQGGPQPRRFKWQLK